MFSSVHPDQSQPRPNLSVGELSQLDSCYNEVMFASSHILQADHMYQVALGLALTSTTREQMTSGFAFYDR